MHVLVEFRIHKPAFRLESAETTRFLQVVGRRGDKFFDLVFVKVRVVFPLHLLIPYFGILADVQIYLVVHPRQTFQRRHRAINLAAPVKDAHHAFFVNIFRRFFVKPHEIEARALKFFAPLIRAFERKTACPAKHVFDDDGVDDAVFKAVFPALLHYDVQNPVGRKIRKYLLLRDFPLHLVRHRHHPPRYVGLILFIGVNSAKQPDRFDRAALGFSRSVSAENPAIFLVALMKLHLFFMHDLARVVVDEAVKTAPFRHLVFDCADFFDNFDLVFFHFPVIKHFIFIE